MLLSASSCLGVVKVCVLCVSVSSLTLYLTQIKVGAILIVFRHVLAKRCYLVYSMVNLLFIG
jgi:cytochrome c oxidase subunit IV